jgi:hypothetical protein
MGQPTSGIAQRVGKTQLWQHTPAIAVTEGGFGEQQFRLLMGAKFSVLFFQSLLYMGTTHLWFRNRHRPQNFFRLRWERFWRSFPNVYAAYVTRRYFIARQPKFLLFDGEQTYMTLAYRHRRLRLASIY